MICSKARLVAAVAALALGGATVLAACSDRDDASPEASSVSAAVSCDPFLERYPVAGPHNGGYDLHALDYTCPPHPGQSPDGSDYLAGDHYGNDLFAKKGRRSSCRARASSRRLASPASPGTASPSATTAAGTTSTPTSTSSRRTSSSARA
ncbi:MAG: hypothetical protein U1F43_07410 [Myxococcota bacterium]